MNMTSLQLLDAVLQKDKEAELLQEALLKKPRGEVLAAVTGVFDAHLDAAGSSEEQGLGVEILRCFNILSIVGGEEGVRTLGRGLDHPNPDVRLAAGEAILDVAAEDFSSLAPLVREVLASKQEGLRSLEELAYLLGDLEDPEAVDLLREFLGHPNPTAVAAALEVLVEIGDMKSIESIRKLVEDRREVWMDAGEENEERATIGELASDALEIMEG